MLFTVLCLYPLGVEMAVFPLCPSPFTPHYPSPYSASYGVDCEVYGFDDIAVKLCYGSYFRAVESQTARGSTTIYKFRAVATRGIKRAGID